VGRTRSFHGGGRRVHLLRGGSELTGGTLQLDVRTVLADDTHGVAVLRVSARRGDRSFDDVHETHVHRFEGGRVTEWRQAFGDQYAIDAVLG
jgi:uncharacterized protein